MKTLDDGLAEAISSLIWVAPRLQADVQELKIVADQFGAKYGKPYAMACRENAVGTGGNSKGFLAQKRPQYRPENRPKVSFEKDTCINFQFWTFCAAFRAIFTTVVPFLIQYGNKCPEMWPQKWPKKWPKSIELPPQSPRS